jgi:ubiquinone/menaquinone biosynthesis C-methylase UbiE
MYGGAMDRSDETERDRVARTFDRYRDDPARRRAWSADNRGNAAIRDELARAVLEVLAERDPGGRLLDLGCGTGWWLQRLGEAGYEPARLSGVELLQERVAAARRRVPGARIDAGDARALTLPDASCALVSLFTVLSGLAGADDVDAVLAQARRVLVPGGAIVIWEPRVLTANPDTRLIRRRALRRALGPSLRVRTITVAPPVARRAARAYPALARVRPLRTHRLAVARPF